MTVKIDLTRSDQSETTQIHFFDSKLDGITIDNASFDDDHDFIIFKKSRISNFNIQILTDSGGTVDFEFYKFLELTDNPPVFGPEWELLTNGTGSVPAGLASSFSQADSASWILLRLKSSSSSVVTIKVFGG